MQHTDDGTLQAWLDGPRSGMDDAARDDVARHLASCEACAARAEALRDMSDRVRTLLPMSERGAPPIPDFGGVLARAAGHTSGHRPARFRTAATWAAGIVAVMGLGWMTNDLVRGVDPVTSVQAPAAARVVAEAAAAPAAGGADAVVADAADAVVATGPASPVAPPVGTAAQPDEAQLPLSFERTRATVAAAEMPPPPAPDIDRERVEQGPRVVRGRVTDVSGRPLESAQVYVEGTGMGALTADDGSFALSLREDMDSAALAGMTLKVELIGFAAASRNLDVDLGDSASADFRLEATALALEALVVTGTAAAAGRAAASAGAPLVAGEAARLASEGRRLTRADQVADAAAGESWAVVGRDDAEARAGFGLYTVPQLTVLSIELRIVNGHPAVRITQDIDGETRLTLVESRSATTVQDPEPGDTRSFASTQRGDVRISAYAEMSEEALSALLDRIR